MERCCTCFSFSFSFSSRWHRSARKGPYSLHPVSQQSPQGCPRNSANICLVEHRSFSTLDGGMSAASFLHSSFLQAVSAVMLWLVRVEKVPQASEHLCPAKLQTRCDICCACQSICPFIPTDSGVPRTVDPQEVFVAEDCAWLLEMRCLACVPSDAYQERDTSILATVALHAARRQDATMRRALVVGNRDLQPSTFNL